MQITLLFQAYRQSQHSTTVQVTRIIALAAVIIAAMLSIAIVFSAWIQISSCQQGQQQSSQAIPVVSSVSIFIAKNVAKLINCIHLLQKY